MCWVGVRVVVRAMSGRTRVRVPFDGPKYRSTTDFPLQKLQNEAGRKRH
jgi:hypothetical protein